jgi:hypothetical protein
MYEGSRSRNFFSPAKSQIFKRISVSSTTTFFVSKSTPIVDKVDVSNLPVAYRLMRDVFPTFLAPATITLNLIIVNHIKFF